MSELRRIIESDYRECVALMEMPADLRQALRAHERTPALLRNLESALSTRKARLLLNRTTIKKVVYDFTENFINAVKQTAEERLLSDAAKAAIRKNESDRKELESIVDAAEQRALITGAPMILEVPE